MIRNENKFSEVTEIFEKFCNVLFLLEPVIVMRVAKLTRDSERLK